MSRKEVRPPLGGLSMDDDAARIRDYGLSRGFLPTDLHPPAAAVPATVSPASPGPSAVQVVVDPVRPTVPADSRIIPRPAVTRPWQAMLPDYLVEALRQAAAVEGTAQKVIVLRALKAAGFRVDDIDLQDLRKR